MMNDDERHKFEHNQFERPESLVIAAEVKLDLRPNTNDPSIWLL